MKRNNKIADQSKIGKLSRTFCQWATLIFCLNFHVLSLNAQTGTYLNLRSSIGFLVPHSESMGHLPQAHANTWELGYSVKNMGNKAWHSKLNNPEQGIAFYLMDPGNSELLGKVLALYGHMDFNLWQKGMLHQTFRFGSGISYVQKSFDRLENNRNVAIGSNFNLGFVFASSVEYEFEKIKIGTGLSLAHASSGAFQVPNLGINIPSIDFKLSYKIHQKETEEIDPLIDKIGFEKWNYDVVLTSGPRAVDVVTGDKYFIHTLQAEVNRRSSEIISFGLGLDYFYNNAIGRLDGDLGSEEALSQLGAKAGVNLIMDRSTLFIQVGNYLVNDSKFHGDMYHRFGGRFMVNRNWILNFSLKTHGTKADNFEAGIGYRIK